MNSIRIDVAFIGQGDCKRASRILEDLVPHTHIKEFMKDLDDLLDGYAESISTPGTSAA
jgi:hypothetical protein